MQKLLKYFTKTYLLLTLGVAVSITACKKDEGPDPVQTLDAPKITVTTDTATAYQAGATVVIKATVTAPGMLKDVMIAGQSVAGVADKTSADVESNYVIPAGTAAGKHEITISATDKQTPARATVKKINLTIEAAPGGACDDFNEGAVNTGEGKIAISDFSAADNGLLKSVKTANTEASDAVAAGVANPAGCGKVLSFTKTPGIWGGWNGFEMDLKQAFSAADFTSFARANPTKVLKVDVYRQSGEAFPADGLVVAVNLGNRDKWAHPLGRSQYLRATLTKDKEWETLTFAINEADAATIDATVTDDMSNLIEIIPAGGSGADGGVYFFDNLRLENK